MTELERAAISMADLRPGQSAAVSKVLLTGKVRRRLQDLGVIPGTVIRCEFHAPAGSPGAYMVLGTVIALRRKDARKVLVCPWD